MAKRSLPAFNTEDPSAENSHARLLEVEKVIKDDVQLAAMFRTTVPTIRKWRRLPLGYQAKRGGRPRKNEKVPKNSETSGDQF